MTVDLLACKRLAGVGALCLLVSFCNDDTMGPGSPRTSHTSRTPSLTVNPGSVRLTYLSDTIRLLATHTDAAGNETHPPVMWVSVDTLVATVDSMALVTAVGGGTTQLDAYIRDLRATVQVVVDQVAARVEIQDPHMFFLDRNEYQEVRAVLSDSAGFAMPEDSAEWSAVDPALIRVPVRCGGTPGLESPCARSLAEGETQLLATYDGLVDTVGVTIAVPRRIRVLNGTTHFFERPPATFQIEAEVLNRRNEVIEGAPITYDDLDSEVLRVDSTGFVTVGGYGEGLISLRSGRVQATVFVSVLVPLKDVRIEPDSLTLYAVGDSGRLQLLATSDVVGGEFPTDADWTSLADSVATVDRGIVVAVAEGEAKIVGSALGRDDETIADTALVRVVPVQRITIVQSDLSLVPTEVTQLTVEGLTRTNERVRNVSARWSSADSTVVSVSASGAATARGYGVTTITATVGEARDSIRAEVGRLTTGIEPRTATLPYPLREQQYRVRLLDRDGSPLPSSPVSWSIGDTMIALIDHFGVVTGRREGTTSVTARVNGRTLTASVTVEDPERRMLMDFFTSTGGVPGTCGTWERCGNWGTDALIYEFPGWEGMVPWQVEDQSQIAPPGPGSRQSFVSEERFYASLDVEAHMRQLLEEYTERKGLGETPPNWIAAAMQDVDAHFDSLSRANVGRVYDLALPQNNMTGNLPQGFFSVLSSLFAVDMRENNVGGSLHGMETVETLFIFIVEANRFTGSLPPLRNPFLLLLGINGNKLTGTPDIAAPALNAIILAQNEFTGQFEPSKNPGAQQVVWSNTASLCAKPGRDYEEWLSAEIRSRAVIAGPICDEHGQMVPGPPFSVQVQARRIPHATAAMENIDLEYQIVDLSGARVVTDTPVVWHLEQLPAPGGDSVVRILQDSPTDREPSIQAKWTGSASVGVQVKNSFLEYIETLNSDTVFVDSFPVITYVPVTVDQEVVAVDVPAVSVGAGTFGAWSFVGKDRNDQPAYVVRPVEVRSSDTSTVRALRNGLLQAGSSAGTAAITVTLQNGVSGTADITVTANTASATAPSIDSIRVSTVSPGDTIVLRGSNLDSASMAFVDGVSLVGPPQDGCTLYEMIRAFYSTLVTIPACPSPAPTWEEAYATLDALLTASEAVNPGGTLPSVFAAIQVPATPSPSSPFIADQSGADSVKFVLPHGPEFQCTADRSIAITVLNDSFEGEAVTATLDIPGTQVNTLSVGESFASDSLAPGGFNPDESVFFDPTPVCLQLPASSSERDYLITVHAAFEPERFEDLTDDDTEMLFPVAARVSADDGLAGSYAEPVVAGGGELRAELQERADLMDAHREAEAALRERERDPANFGRPIASARAAGRLPPSVTSATQPGDVVELVHGFGSCGSTNLVRGVVKEVGTHVVMVADLNNENDYTDADYRRFTEILDEEIVPPLTAYFGDFSDVNDDGRVTVLFTDEVGSVSPGLLGWVSFLDVLGKDECAASNEMEIFYGRTPDRRARREVLIEIVPSLIAHELAHVIQSRAVVDTDDPKDVEEAAEAFIVVWAAEAQATLAEEVVGFSVQGTAPGQNYGPEAFANQREGLGQWQLDAFRDLWAYTRERLKFQDGVSDTGPCSWWSANPNPCGGRSLWYGVGWSFLRFLNDQYFEGLAAGGAFHSEMIDNGSDVWSYVESKTGEEFEDLLSDWNAMLYLDDHLVYTGLPAYQMTSWNLREILNSFGLSFVAGPSPEMIPSANQTLPNRNVKLSSGLRYLVDTSGAHEEKSILFNLDAAAFRRTIPLIFPIRVIRIK